MITDLMVQMGLLFISSQALGLLDLFFAWGSRMSSTNPYHGKSTLGFEIPATGSYWDFITQITGNTLKRGCAFYLYLKQQEEEMRNGKFTPDMFGYCLSTEWWPDGAYLFTPRSNDAINGI